MRGGRWIVIGLALAGAIAAGLVWLALFGAEPLARYAARHLADRPGMRVKAAYGGVRGNLLREVSFDHLLLAGAQEDTLFAAERITLRWNPLALLTGRVAIGEIHAVNPVVRLAPPPEGAGPAGGGRDDGPPPLFPLGLRVGLVRVEGGRFETTVAGAPLSLEELHGVARNELAGGAWNVQIARGFLAWGERRLPLETVTLRVSFPGGARRVEVGEIGVGSSHLGVTGEWSGARGEIDGRVQLDPLRLEDVAHLADVDLPLRGEVEGSVSAKGRADSLAVVAFLRGRPAGRDSVDVALMGTVGRDRVDMHRLRAGIGDGAIEGEGELFREEGRYRASFRLENLAPLSWLMASPPETPVVLRGALAVEGEGFHRGERRARADLRLAASDIGPVEVDSARVLAVKSPGGSVDGTFFARVRADSVGGSITLASDGTLSGDAVLHVREGAALAGILRSREAAAAGTVTGRVEGELARPQLRIEGQLRDVRVRDLAARNVTFALQWDPERRESVTATFHADSLATEGLRAEELSFRLLGTPRETEVHDLYLRRGPVEAKAEGRIVRRPDRLEAEIEGLELRTADRAWDLEKPTRVVRTGDTVRLEPFHLASRGASVEGSGTLRGDSVQVTLALAGLELRELGDIRALGGPAAGELAATLALRGTRRNLNGEGKLELGSGVIHGMPLRRVSARARFGDGMLEVTEGVVETAGGTIGFTGRMPLGRDGWRRAQLQARTDDLRLSALRPLSPKLERTEGRADLVITLENLQAPRAEIAGAVRGLVVGDFDPGDVHVQATLADSMLRVTELTAAGASGRVRLAGSIPVSIDLSRGHIARREGDLEATLVVEEGDMAVIPNLTRSLEHAAGRFSGQARIAGRVEDPLVYGEAKVEDAELVLRGLRDLYYGVSGRLVFDGRDITLENVRGREGAQGRIAVTGTAAMERYKVYAYLLEIHGTDYEPQSWHDVSGRVRGDITLRTNRLSTGRVVPHLEGRIDVDHLVYRRRFEGQTEYGPAAPPTGQFAIPVTVTLDLELHADDNVYLENQDVRMELWGDVVARYDEAGLRMLGTMNSTRGQYFLYNHVFDIRQGEFTFSEVTTLDDVGIDIRADTEVGGERIDVVITGSLRDPRIEATSESGLSETEIFRALTVGYRTEDPGGGGTSFTRGLVDSWRESLIERLGGHVARGIGIDRVGFRSDPAAGESPRLEVGKRLRSDLYLNFQYALRSERPDDRLADWELQNAERLLSLEYRLSERFSLDGEAGTVEGLEFLNLDLKYRLSY